VSCGLTPARFAEGYWSVWVAKDSPAAKANIRSGTRLIEVNGTDLKDASYTEVAGKLAAEEGGTLSVTVLQGSETRTTPLAVQPLL
jgi:C-terminal processing protease CtpA/Prc